MNHVLQGIQLGLMLAILVGPLLMILVQASLEQGFRAGLAAGSGIWFSDALYMVGVYFGLTHLDRLLSWSGFELVVGLSGAALLAVFGAVSLFARPPDFSHPEDFMPRRRTYGLLWLKGFLVNTINPFTVFFWVSIIGTMVVKRGLDGEASTLFLGSILCTIVATDTLKVLLAKRIRTRLRPIHLVFLRRIAGVSLLLFGLILLVRVLWWE